LKQFSDLLDIDSRDMSESDLGKTQLAVVLLVSQLRNENINESIRPAVMSIHDKLLRIYGMSNPVMLEIIANIESGPSSRASSARIPGSRSSTAPGVQHEGNHIQNSAFFPNFGGMALDPAAIASNPREHQFVPDDKGNGARQPPEKARSEMAYFPGSSPPRGVKFADQKHGGRVLFPEENILEEEGMPGGQGESPVKNRAGTPFTQKDGEEAPQGESRSRSLDIPSPQRIVREEGDQKGSEPLRAKPAPKSKSDPKLKPAVKKKPAAAAKPQKTRHKDSEKDKPWLNKPPALVRKAPGPGTQLEKRVREIERLQAKRNAGLKKKQDDEEREKEKSRKLERALKAKRERLAMQHRRKEGEDGLAPFGGPPSKGSSLGAGARGHKQAGLRSAQNAPDIEELVIEALNARLQDNPKMVLPTGFKRIEKKNMEYRPQTPYVVQYTGGVEPAGEEGSAQKLTDQMNKEPDLELPEGYEKVVPRGHQAQRLVAEILDDITYKCLRLHILEPRESKGTCVVAQRDPMVPLQVPGAVNPVMPTRAKIVRPAAAPFVRSEPVGNRHAVEGGRDSPAARQKQALQSEGGTGRQADTGGGCQSRQRRRKNRALSSGKPPQASQRLAKSRTKSPNSSPPG